MLQRLMSLYERVRRPRMTDRLAIVAAAGLVLAGCTSGRTGTIPSTISLGPSGHRFEASFPTTPTESVVSHRFNGWPQFNESVRRGWHWYGGNVNVWLFELPHQPSASNVKPFLLWFLPLAHGGRIVRRSGRPAAIETVPCSTPAGSCSGTVGTLVVLDHSWIYEISETGWASTDAAAILNSFRLVK